MGFGEGFDERTATVYAPKSTGPGFNSTSVGTLEVHLQPAGKAEYLARERIGAFNGVMKKAFIDGIPSFTIKVGYKIIVNSINYKVFQIDDWDDSDLEHWVIILEGVD